MKLLRISLVCTLLLLAATPSFALGCTTCVDGDPYGCDSTPGSGTRCLFHIDYCENRSASCNGLAEQTADVPTLADWTVASIEVSRPADAQVANAQTAAAKADAHVASLK
jgi:hypothetical protein